MWTVDGWREAEGRKESEMENKMSLNGAGAMFIGIFKNEERINKFLIRVPRRPPKPRQLFLLEVGERVL